MVRSRDHRRGGKRHVGPESHARRHDPAPIGALVGMSLADVERGRVVMHLTPAGCHYNPIGTVHGGVLATLPDAVMGCAVHTTLPRGRAYRTLEIKVNELRAVTGASGQLAAEGKVVHAGR